MKVVAIFFALVAVAVAAPPSQDYKSAVITKYEADNIGVGGYNYAVETSDGQIKQEQGQLQNEGTDQEAVVAQGSYQYVGPDGIQYQVSYVADENGFQPQGAHLPH